MARLKISEVNREHVAAIGRLVARLDHIVIDFDRDNRCRVVVLELRRHGCGKLIREDVLVGAVGVDVARNRAGKLVLDKLIHAGVGGLIGARKHVGTKRAVLVILDGLGHVGDALLGGYINVRATNNGENRRSIHVSIAGLTGHIGHEKPVALV